MPTCNIVETPTKNNGNHTNGDLIVDVYENCRKTSACDRLSRL